jgi:hypothetical protein
VGKVDETRISNIARSASWIKATYYSNWDNLVTFGSEESPTQFTQIDSGISGLSFLQTLSGIRGIIEDLNIDISSGIKAKQFTQVDSGISGLYASQILSGIRGIIEDLNIDILSGIKGFLTKNTDVDSGIKGKGYSQVNSGVLGLPVLQIDSAIRGIIEDLNTNILSGIKGILIKEFDADSGIKGLAAAIAGSGIAGLSSLKINSGIIGGEADVFGFSYPLADPIPLRNTTIWGSFKNVQTIPHVYGRVRLAPIPYDEAGKLFVMADHGIQGVDEVQIDDETIYTWKFKNTLDSSDSPVAMLELAESLASGSSLIALVRGKVHSLTGALLVNPADILWDILANIVGASVTYATLDKFRVECALYGIEIGGLLDDRERSVKAQLDLITKSIGAIWSGGMPGLFWNTGSS